MKSPWAKWGWFQNFVKNRQLIFSKNHPKNMWLLVHRIEQKFSTNAMSSYTENDLLFVPVDFITFRLISSFRLISREKPDVYKETSGWFHTTMWLYFEYSEWFTGYVHPNTQKATNFMILNVIYQLRFPKFWNMFWMPMNAKEWDLQFMKNSFGFIKYWDRLLWFLKVNFADCSHDIVAGWIL